MKTIEHPLGAAKMQSAKQDLSWMKVVGLGVAAAVSGNFSGWNFGLGVGGWGGMVIAALIMGAFYILLTRCVAELASACPNASGMDSYAAYGLGRHGGFIVGISVAVALSFAVGLGISFIEAYCGSLLGLNGWAVKAPLLLLLIGVQLRGARDAVGFTMVMGFVSVLIVVIFSAAAAPYFSASNLYSNRNGVPSLLRDGLHGVVACVPYALFMFLGVEQAANAAGDMGAGRKHLPKALLVATAIILCIGFGSLLFATGVAGVEHLAQAGDPLFAAIVAGGAYPSGSVIVNTIGGGAILSLLGTIFSLAYGASSQFHSLATAGDLPTVLAKQNSRGAPHCALILVGTVAAIASVLDTNMILVGVIFCLSICHQLVLIAFLRLRIVKSGIDRPYRAKAGMASAFAAIALSLLIMWACAGLQRTALAYIAAGYAVLVAYSYLWPRKPG